MSRHIFFWHLSELAESIVWRLTLTWGNSVIVSNVSPVPFFLLLVFPLHTLQPFVHSPWIFCSVFSSFCSLLLSSSGGFYQYILKLRDSFLSCVQSANKPINSILKISVNKPISSIFYFCYFLKNLQCSFWFLGFPSLHLHCPSVFACCLLYPLECLAY